MPTLDYMVLADYVRQDNGVVHIMGAGIDTITAPHLPAAHLAHVAIKLIFGTEEVPGTRHTFKLLFMGDDKQLSAVKGTFKVPERIEGVPVHWKTSALLNLRLALPFERYGDYSLDFLIDEQQEKDVNLRVVPPEKA
jgi:hypothetical protein